jgi:transposase-like protein
MGRSEFRRLLTAIEELGIEERRAVRAVLEDGRANVEERIVETRAPDRPQCPHCDRSRVIRWGSARGLPRFRCKGCLRTFNPLTGTSLARLKKRARWGRHAECLARGDVLREAAANCGVHISTAHRWRHRFLASVVSQGAEVGGIVEADETWVSRSAKGQTRVRQRWGREARARASDQRVAGRSREQVFVVVARDRSGRTRDAVLDRVSVRGLVDTLRPHLASDAVLCSDGWRAYAGAAAKLGVRHEVLNATRRERRRGPFHLQNVNNYHGRWKGWMHRFRGVATSYLPNYAAWFRHLDAQAKNPNSKIMLDLALAA